MCTTYALGDFGSIIDTYTGHIKHPPLLVMPPLSILPLTIYNLALDHWGPWAANILHSSLDDIFHCLLFNCQASHLPTGTHPMPMQWCGSLQCQMQHSLRINQSFSIWPSTCLFWTYHTALLYFWYSVCLLATDSVWTENVELVYQYYNSRYLTPPFSPPLSSTSSSLPWIIPALLSSCPLPLFCITQTPCTLLWIGWRGLMAPVDEKGNGFVWILSALQALYTRSGSAFELSLRPVTRLSDKSFLMPAR